MESWNGLPLFWAGAAGVDGAVFRDTPGIIYLINTWRKDVFKHIIKLGSFCRLFNNTQAHSSHGNLAG